VIAELRTRQREIGGDGTKNQEKRGLKRKSCASQYTMRGMAGRSLDPACNSTNTRSSQPNGSSPNPDFSYPLVSFTSLSSSSPSLPMWSTTPPSSQNTKLCYTSPSLHAMIMSWHWVRHTPSTAFTKYRTYPSLFVFLLFPWLQVDPWM